MVDSKIIKINMMRTSNEEAKTFPKLERKPASKEKILPGLNSFMKVSLSAKLYFARN